MNLIKVLIAVTLVFTAGCFSTPECELDSDCSEGCALLADSGCADLASCACVGGECTLMGDNVYLECIGFSREPEALFLDAGEGRYKARQPGNLTLWVKVLHETNATVRVRGIALRRGPLVNILEQVTLKQGVNRLQYSFQLPSCSSCTGLAPGEHIIAAEVSYDNNTFNTSMSITVEE